MNTFDVACCCFPTTVLFVDDKVGYLDSLLIILDNSSSYKFYSDPAKAISFIEKNSHTLSYIDKWAQNLKASNVELSDKLEDGEYTHSYLDIDISAIHQQIYSSDRFKEISLVVVDFSMPQINGLEFCNRIKDLPIMKLMVTGRADYEFGVKALNEGIIDRFIIKGSKDFNKNLNKTIKQMQHDYFCRLSNAIIQHLVTNPYCCLSRKEFVKKINEVLEDKNFIEYYLIKDNGSFLLLDKNGNINYLVAKTEDEILEDYQIACDNNAPKFVKLDNGKTLLRNLSSGRGANLFTLVSLSPYAKVKVQQDIKPESIAPVLWHRRNLEFID